MEDNILNRIYGKPIDIHIRHDHGETETLQKELIEGSHEKNVFQSETAELNQMNGTGF